MRVSCCSSASIWLLRAVASAIAAGLAQKLSLEDSVTRARAYVLAAIKNAPGYGKGHGPLDHAVTFSPLPLGEKGEG